VILSLTRTSRVGFLRDIRRLTVALSRARFGLYILGRREVFESCFELRQAFEILLQRPSKLMLVTGELWPSNRVLKDEEGADVPGETQMENVEHLGQYVYEMTNSKVQQLRAERGLHSSELVAPVGEEDVQFGYIEGEEYFQEIEEGFEAEEEG
jgi:intron-binding protein aquarius